MAEKRYVIQDRVFGFDGIFSLKDLFRTINKWFSDRDYSMLENKNFEEIYEDSKKIQFELGPSKKISDYHKFEIRLGINCHNLKEVEIEQQGVKIKLLKGQVDIVIDAILITDYENKWQSNAHQFFFRAMMDKFIHKSYTDQAEGQLRSDAAQVEQEIKAYLNMFRYQV